MRNAIALFIHNFSSAFWGSILAVTACWFLVGWLNPSLGIDFSMWKDNVFTFGIAYATLFAAIHVVYNPSLRSVFFSTVLFTALGLLIGLVVAFGEINYVESASLIALQSCSQIIAITAGTCVMHWASTGNVLR